MSTHEPHENDAIAIKQRTCQKCGMLLRDAGEYHPYEFCLLRKAGILDPWQVVKRFCVDLSLGEPPMYARIRDLPKSGLERLRKLAEEATPGPWVHDDYQPTRRGAPIYAPEQVGDVYPIIRCHTYWAEANAAFIAAADPPTVQALIDVARAARKHMEAVHRGGKPVDDCSNPLCEALVRLSAAEERHA